MFGEKGENFEKNKKFMTELQSIQMERQIHMQDQMRLRMQAMQLARAREMFYWWATFYGLGLIGAILVVRKTKRKAALFPFFPLTFIVGYQADLAYGSKMKRIRDEASFIMQFEPDLLEQPGGVPSASSIDSARNSYHDEKRFKVHDSCP